AGKRLRIAIHHGAVDLAAVATEKNFQSCRRIPAKTESTSHEADLARALRPNIKVFRNSCNLERIGARLNVSNHELSIRLKSDRGERFHERIDGSQLSSSRLQTHRPTTIEPDLSRNRNPRTKYQT